MEKRIVIHEFDRCDFRNHTRMCVGTGRMDLGLHAEYQKQLRAVQEACHFRYIRGHGLFSDQMGIYQERRCPDGTVRVEYCFTYLDRVVDACLENGIRPFLELGFMPEKLAGSDQKLFYWKACTVPPRDMDAWCSLVKATLSHLSQRYGREEAESWPCEIWNEPNLDGFWEHADKQKYLELYRATALAVKEALPGMQVGGPAICGGEGSQQWIDDFLAFCREQGVPVDFVTRHVYMAETPEQRGRYTYHRMRTVDSVMDEMRESREIIDRYPEYRGIPLYITEFNTSYSPRCPIHDTNENAAYCAALLARLGDVADGYSYWTFGDVFEESGIAPTPFHGGFGMMADGLIPKPTLWAFSFFAGLKGEAMYRDDAMVMVKRPDGGYEAVVWNLCGEKKEPLEIRLSVPFNGKAAVLLDRVDGETCNPLKAWRAMGHPTHLSEEQLQFLRAAGQPRREAYAVDALDGQADVSLRLLPHAVLRIRILPASDQTDDGYDDSYYAEN